MSNTLTKQTIEKFINDLVVYNSGFYQFTPNRSIVYHINANDSIDLFVKNSVLHDVYYIVDIGVLYFKNDDIININNCYVDVLKLCDSVCTSLQGLPLILDGRKITISKYNNIKNLLGIPRFKILDVASIIEISDCDNLTSLNGIQEDFYGTLKLINLHGIKNLEDFSCENIGCIDIVQCNSFEGFLKISNFKNLSIFKIKYGSENQKYFQRNISDILLCDTLWHLSSNMFSFDKMCGIDIAVSYVNRFKNKKKEYIMDFTLEMIDNGLEEFL